MKKTWVPSLGQEDPWGQEMATHYSNSCLENCLDRGAWRATIHGVTKSQTLSTQSNWKAARFPFRSAGQEGWVFVRICRDGRTPGGSVLIAVAEGGASGLCCAQRGLGPLPAPRDLRPRGCAPVHLAAARLPFLPRSSSGWNALRVFFILTRVSSKVTCRIMPRSFPAFIFVDT